MICPTAIDHSVTKNRVVIVSATKIKDQIMFSVFSL